MPPGASPRFMGRGGHPNGLSTPRMKAKMVVVGHAHSMGDTGSGLTLKLRTPGELGAASAPSPTLSEVA